MNRDALLQQVEDLKPAPMPLLAVQALIDTRVIKRGEEVLSDPEAAGRWLRSAGLVSSAATVDESGFERLIEFREALRAALDADRGAGDALAAIAAERPIRVRLGGAGSVELDLEPAESIGELISQLLGIAHDAAVDGGWERLKLCAAEDCRWAFYDSTRNRAGHWCSMELCGNQAKARAHRARARA